MKIKIRFYRDNRGTYNALTDTVTFNPLSVILSKSLAEKNKKFLPKFMCQVYCDWRYCTYSIFPISLIWRTLIKLKNKFNHDKQLHRKEGLVDNVALN